MASSEAATKPKRAFVSEYPIPEEPEKSVEQKGGPITGSITLNEIQSDRLTKIASENWSVSVDTLEKPFFNPDLVDEIYRTELLVTSGSKSVPLRRIMVLEVSQYLEKYLWPHFDAEKSSFEHVMSIILMVNEKFRENVPAWKCFHERVESFEGFLRRVLLLKHQERTLNIAEKTNYLIFLIHSFQSLEDDLVRGTVLKMVNLQLWQSLSPGRFKMEMCLHPQLIKKWRKRKRKEEKERRKEQPDGTEVSNDCCTKLEVSFMPNLVQEFLKIIDSKVIVKQDDVGKTQEANSDDDSKVDVDDACLLYCERFLEFLIDLLSQLPTRRHLRPLVEDLAIVAKCRLSRLYSHTKGKLFQQLVDLVRFYEGFEIDDHVGTQLSDDDVLLAHCQRLQAFQLLAFKEIPKLQELALSNVGSIEKRLDLCNRLKVLSPAELMDLVCNKLKLISTNDPWIERASFLMEVMVSTFEKRQSQKEAINALPLYPNEQIMWDESVVPSINYTGEGCLALPKLNLQFLTLHDYLLRNFNLFRLESTYGIREDVQDVVPHLRAYINSDGETSFGGWARMAVPIQEFRITQVKQPNIGEVKPAAVRAEVKFSISRYTAQIRSEWNGLKEHDVLFLLSIRPFLEPLDSEDSSKLTIPERLGLQYVRGCEVIEVRDEENHLMNDFTGKVKRDEWKPPKGDLRTVVVALDAAQYQMDVNEMSNGTDKEDVYKTFNVLLRRKPKENNFKAILESIRDLMNESCIIPQWLHDVFLGYGNPSAAQWFNMPDNLDVVDFKDTFLDANHLRECFPGYDVSFMRPGGKTDNCPKPPFRITFPKMTEREDEARKRARTKEDDTQMLYDGGNAQSTSGGRNNRKKITVESYVPPDRGPYPKDQPKKNSVRFTSVQVEAIISGIQPGLTMVVGPPGTGKTDTAVQILNVLYHNCPNQRTLIITHSNQALNDLFEKIMQSDVPARYLLRLGHGEQELATDMEFSRQGRVNAMLACRIELLSEVERLAKSLHLLEDVGYTCETAGYFWLLHVYSRWEQFLAACEGNHDKPNFVKDRFPFKEFFSNASQPLFSGVSYEDDMRVARGCFRHLSTMFQELEECKAFELLKSTADRASYLMTKQAKIVAMTCTHAALKRKDFIQLGFKYDNLLMEESAQILEIETFIPMLLQRQEDGLSRLKRCILIGDHHQLPPVVKNMAFQKYSHMDQSLFTRFIRLGIPYVELNAQGRARPSIAKLYNWRYRQLGDLPYVKQEKMFQIANPGFCYEYQLVNVPDYRGVGESAPIAWFYQNLGEAEYIVSVFMYMRLLGYPASKISILTTYNGQKHLIRDVIRQRCASNPLIGSPSKVTTVDRFQGQQNDYILLSLVRTRFVGHLRDVRRLVVAMSRARLGIYVFCRRSLFEQCYELQPTFKLLLQRPDRLALNLDEQGFPTERPVGERGRVYLAGGIEEMEQIALTKYYELCQAQQMMHHRLHDSQMQAMNSSESSQIQAVNSESCQIQAINCSDTPNLQAGDSSETPQLQAINPSDATTMEADAVTTDSTSPIEPDGTSASANGTES